MGCCQPTPSSSSSSTSSRRGCCDDPEIAPLLGPEAQNASVDDDASSSDSIIQFSTAIFYCNEDEGEAHIDIIRLGETHSAASCRFQTFDGSARAGKKYVQASISVLFQPCEVAKTMVIPIIDDGRPDSTLEFNCVIDQVRGAQLGRYLDRCRVLIIDDDTFPTNKYREVLENRTHPGKTGIPRRRLMLEFLRMNLRDKKTCRITCLWVTMDSLKALYFLLTLYLQLYLVDVVILGNHEKQAAAGNFGEAEAGGRILTAVHAVVTAGVRMLEAAEGAPEAEGDVEDDIFSGELLVPGSHRKTAIVVGVLYMAPFLLLQIIDLLKVRLGLDCIARKRLQVNLFRKFLNYQESQRQHTSLGDIVMAMTRDVPEVIDHGFMKILKLLRIFSKLGLAVMFIMMENQMAVPPLATFPFIMIVFLLCREQATVEQNEDMAFKQNQLVHMISEVTANFRLIADFHLRGSVVQTLETCIEEFSKESVEFHTVLQNNHYLAPWLTTIIIGCFMIFGTFETSAFGGTISLGTFIATINVFKEIGIELQEIYREINEIQISFGALEKIVYLSNINTDLPERMRVHRQRRNDLLQHVDGIFADGVFAVDRLPIELVDVSYGYTDERPIFRNMSQKFAQGKFYAFTGPSHQGKATLLKLLGQLLVPQLGDLFIAPHLRVVHVSRDAFYLNESLLLNITLKHDVGKLGGYERIRRICIACGFSPAMMRLLAEPEQLDKTHMTQINNAWKTQLSLTDGPRFNLARVLVMNPECLVMHMPFNAFAEDEAAVMAHLMRKFVDERGVELEKSDVDFRLRRFRTVFCSNPGASSCLLEADAVFELDANSGLKQVPVSGVSTKGYSG